VQSRGNYLLSRLLGHRRDSKADNLALVYWTRSARQANIDSLLKMGDWYLKGYGIPSPDPLKAVTCYQAAVDNLSPLAMWDMGWCHENGVGVEQDFHLAKRYYDLAKTTNDDATLPVMLSLGKLYARSYFNKLSRGKINSIGQDAYLLKADRKTKWTFTQAFQDIIRKWTEDTDDTHLAREDEEDNVHEYDPEEELDIEYGESLIILGLCLAVALLLWMRNTRSEQERWRRGRQNQAEEERGLFPDPNDRDNPEFARWVGAAPI
jgi:SEL1 protein